MQKIYLLLILTVFSSLNAMFASIDNRKNASSRTNKSLQVACYLPGEQSINTSPHKLSADAPVFTPTKQHQCLKLNDKICATNQTEITQENLEAKIAQYKLKVKRAQLKIYTFEYSLKTADRKKEQERVILVDATTGIPVKNFWWCANMMDQRQQLHQNLYDLQDKAEDLQRLKFKLYADTSQTSKANSIVSPPHEKNTFKKNHASIPAIKAQEENLPTAAPMALATHVTVSTEVRLPKNNQKNIQTPVLEKQIKKIVKSNKPTIEELQRREQQRKITLIQRNAQEAEKKQIQQQKMDELNFLEETINKNKAESLVSRTSPTKKFYTCVDLEGQAQGLFHKISYELSLCSKPQVCECLEKVQLLSESSHQFTKLLKANPSLLISYRETMSIMKQAVELVNKNMHQLPHAQELLELKVRNKPNYYQQLLTDLQNLQYIPKKKL